MLAADSRRVLEGWPYLPGPQQASGRSLREVLQPITVVAEDAGPDSIMSLVMLLAACACIPLSDFFPAWQQAIDDWERHGNAFQPMHSWCALESALVHRCFPIHTPITAAAMSKAWGEGLRFLAAALLGKLKPEGLPELAICPEHANAKSALQQEQQAYEQWLRHSEVVQLAVPLATASDRHLLLDAIFVQEEQTTGSAKVFYRNDHKHSPLGKGFALAVHHRPHSTESDLDITIAVDPRRGVALTQLHQAIEAAETQAWTANGQARSTDPPRYLEGVPCLYEQPWYIDRDHTLIAAPRPLGTGQKSSYLTRDRVLEIIWETYYPLQGVRVLPSPKASTPISILQVQPVPLPGPPTGKRLLSALWLRGDQAAFPIALPDAPTVWRVLAAMTRQGNDAVPALHSLPSSGDYNYVQLSGGLAVVTDAGAFVLDDWTPGEIEWDAVKDTFSAAAQLNTHLLQLQKQVSSFASDLAQQLAKGALPIKATQRLLRKVSSAGTQLSQVQAAYASPPPNANARTLQQALALRWALDAQLTALNAETLSLTTALRTSLEIGTASTTRFIATFGLAAGIGAALASPVAKWLAPHWTHAPATQDAPGNFVVAAFVILASLAWLLLHLWFRDIDLLKSDKPYD